jgi:hypothetical protein
MPAKSGAQQKAAGAALAAKRGERKASSLKGASRSMYESISENDLDEMTSTARGSFLSVSSHSRATRAFGHDRLIA